MKQCTGLGLAHMISPDYNILGGSGQRYKCLRWLHQHGAYLCKEWVGRGVGGEGHGCEVGEEGMGVKWVGRAWV